MADFFTFIAQYPKAYALIFGLHIFCQIFYTMIMLAEKPSYNKKVLWLAVIWLVPVIGICIAGARYSKKDPNFRRNWK